MVEKAKYSEPCTRCGYCCSESLCPAAEIAFPDTRPPCPAIFVEDDITSCGLVILEELAACAGIIEPVVSKTLGIGCGCSCPDDDTTQEQVEQFDRISYIQMYGKE